MGLPMNTMTEVIHPFVPYYSNDSRILILGSFPSVKSREVGFYYGHKQNRFWKVTAHLRGEEVPQSVEEKKAFLLRNHIALYDVIQSCEIRGSSDASIRNAVPTDLNAMIQNSRISAVFCNGKTAFHLYEKYQKTTVSVPCFFLPSTSAANAAVSFDRLVEKWKIINDILDRKE